VQGPPKYAPENVVIMLASCIDLVCDSLMYDKAPNNREATYIETPATAAAPTQTCCVS